MKYKFRAYDIKRNIIVNDGDYWLPHSHEFANASNCYPVKVINHGILYSKKLRKNNDHNVIVDGQSYYCNWEFESLYNTDIELELIK